MNRIQQWPSTSSTPADSATQVEQAWLTTAEHQGQHYCLFAPLHYEPNYAYPLLVWLHGPDDDERQIKRIMPHISMRNYVAVAPRGSCLHRQVKHGFDWEQTDSSIAATEQRVLDCIEAAQQKFHVAPQRIFLAGFESGGTMAFRIALRHPRRFAGVLSAGGPFPKGKTPLLRLQQARQLPLFIAHGRDAGGYPIEMACEELRLFHVAGLSVTLRQYPCGDELNTQMLRDMDVWMMEQVTGVSCAPDDAHARPGESN